MDRENNVITLAPSYDVSGYKYQILPGHCSSDIAQIDLHNRAFNIWKECWTEVFKQISGEALKEDDFWRQHLVCVLTKNDVIAAVHLYSFFNISSTAATAHSYFKGNYKPHHLENLRKLGVQNVMTMEYFTVTPEFRHGNHGIPLASVVLGLGYRVFNESNYDGALGNCRRDFKVDQKASEFGMIPFSEEYTNHNVPVINMVLLKGQMKKHPNPQLDRAINQIWNNRTDLTEITTQTSAIKKVA